MHVVHPTYEEKQNRHPTRSENCRILKCFSHIRCHSCLEGAKMALDMGHKRHTAMRLHVTKELEKDRDILLLLWWEQCAAKFLLPDVLRSWCSSCCMSMGMDTGQSVFLLRPYSPFRGGVDQRFYNLPLAQADLFHLTVLPVWIFLTKWGKGWYSPHNPGVVNQTSILLGQGWQTNIFYACCGCNNNPAAIENRKVQP